MAFIERPRKSDIITKSVFTIMEHIDINLQPALLVSAVNSSQLLFAVDVHMVLAILMLFIKDIYFLRSLYSYKMNEQTIFELKKYDTTL